MIEILIVPTGYYPTISMTYLTSVVLKAELETPEDMVATAVFHQSDKLFPSNLTWQMSVSGSSEEEEKTAYNDLTENIHEAEQVLLIVKI